MPRRSADTTVTLVSEIMSTELHTLPPDASLADVQSLMNKHRIRHVPIVNAGGELVGLVSQRDVLAASDSRLADQASRRDPSSIRIRDFMTRHLVTVNPETSARRAGLHMERRKIGCLLVVAEKKLLGIVTDTDFVGLAINLLEQVEEATPEEPI